MSETRFTPGPWSTPHFAMDGVECQCGHVLVEGYCGAVATVNWSCSRDLEHGDNPPSEEAVANAHLIAAAPDMYKALKEVRTQVCGDKITALIDAALAKAEGKGV